MNIPHTRARFIFCLIIFTLFASAAHATLPAPTLSGPTTGITLKSFEAFLSYYAVTGATGYQVQYDTVITFNSSHLRDDTSSLTYQYTKVLHKGKKYFWRARAYKPGDTSAWSGAYNFTIFTKTELGLPYNTSTGGITSLICNNAGTFVSCAYSFEADTTPSFNSPLHVFKSQTEAALVDTPLFVYGRKIYWRARANNAVGDTLEWSDTWQYTIYTKPTINSGFANEHPQNNITWPTLNLAETILQVDTTNAFNSPLLSEKTFAPRVTADTLHNLIFGRRYYYRIRGKFANNLSDWSDTKQKTVVLNGYISTPSQGETISSLVFTFSWQQLTGTFTQFQLYRDSAYTQLLKDTVVNNSYCAYPDTFRLNTKYYMRIRYYHQADTTPWINRWFKTYNGGVQLLSPYHQSVNNQVRLRFQFYKENWATGYIMEIDTGNTFQPQLSGYGIRLTSFQQSSFGNTAYADTSLRYNQTYVWRVTAIKGPDTAGASQSYIFRTNSIPLAYFPPNNTIGTGTGTNALVTGIKGSTYIQWELDTSLSFQSGEHFSGTDLHVPDEFFTNYVGLNWPKDLLFESKYYWRARCINPVDTSPWSVPFDFVTTQQPYNIEPPNNALSLDPEVDIILKWSIQGSSSDYIYQYQLSTDPGLAGAPVISLPADESPEVTVATLYKTKYYWRARATHSRDTSVWSPVFNFTTADPPVLFPPALVQPTNKVTNVPVGPVILQWGSVAFAKNYEAQVAGDSLFTMILASATTEGNGVSFSGAQPLTRYFWRVRARLNSITGPWSAEWWFQTGPLTGMSEAGDHIAVSIKPNPALDAFSIESEEAGTIKVYNSNGACVYEDEQLLNKRTVNTQEWANGIYFVLIQSGDKQSSKHVVISGK